jgi:hypothetical protein
MEQIASFVWQGGHKSAAILTFDVDASCAHQLREGNILGSNSSGDYGPKVGLPRILDLMVPGMEHCQGGPGPGTFAALAAWEQWVGEGVAPEQIPGSHLTNGQVDLTRPLCPYPAVYRRAASVPTLECMPSDITDMGAACLFAH